jgi:L-rhamnose isomerase
MSYKKQYDKAKQTYFRIDKTSFTTVTTNVNFQTTIHTDKGDDAEGFGNLVVIENGKYTGGETCFPQYGIGVNVRTGDVLFMDVHQWHGNLPVIKDDPDAKRLSIVCYLRHNVWKNTKGKPKSFLIKRTEEIMKLTNETITKKNITKKNITKKNITKKNIK